MNLKDKKVMITGGGGLLGSHMAEKFVEKGAKVTVVDIDSENVRKNLEPIKDRIEFVSWDITDYDASRTLPRDFNVIVHLAAVASPSVCEKNPEMAFKINVQGAYNALRFAGENSLDKFIFSSTAGLYGIYPKYVPIDEKHPIEIQSSVYNVTKRIGEDLCNSFRENNGVPVTVLRLFTTFGPRQTTDYFFPTLITQAIKNGKVELWSDKPTRDFNYVDNTIDAFVKAAESDFVGGPINIGSGNEIKIGDIAKKIASQLGAEVTFLNKDVVGPMRLCCDNRKAKEVLGWEPKVSFEEGLKRTIDWYKENV